MRSMLVVTTGSQFFLHGKCIDVLAHSLFLKGTQHMFMLAYVIIMTALSFKLWAVNRGHRINWRLGFAVEFHGSKSPGDPGQSGK